METQDQSPVATRAELMSTIRDCYASTSEFLLNISVIRIDENGMARFFETGKDALDAIIPEAWDDYYECTRKRFEDVLLGKSDEFGNPFCVEGYAFYITPSSRPPTFTSLKNYFDLSLDARSAILSPSITPDDFDPNAPWEQNEMDKLLSGLREPHNGELRGARYWKQLGTKIQSIRHYTVVQAQAKRVLDGKLQHNVKDYCKRNNADMDAFMFDIRFNLEKTTQTWSDDENGRLLRQIARRYKPDDKGWVEETVDYLHSVMLRSRASIDAKIRNLFLEKAGKDLQALRDFDDTIKKILDEHDDSIKNHFSSGPNCAPWSLEEYHTLFDAILQHTSVDDKDWRQQLIQKVSEQLNRTERAISGRISWLINGKLDDVLESYSYASELKQKLAKLSNGLNGLGVAWSQEENKIMFDAILQHASSDVKDWRQQVIQQVNTAISHRKKTAIEGRMLGLLSGKLDAVLESYSDADKLKQTLAGLSIKFNESWTQEENMILFDAILQHASADVKDWRQQVIQKVSTVVGHRTKPAIEGRLIGLLSGKLDTVVESHPDADKLKQTLAKLSKGRNLAWSQEENKILFDAILQHASTDVKGWRQQVIQQVNTVIGHRTKYAIEGRLNGLLSGKLDAVLESYSDADRLKQKLAGLRELKKKLDKGDKS